MRWIDPPPPLPNPLTELPPLVAQTLLRRGQTTPAAARAFLDPAAFVRSAPAELPGLTAAADRVEAAIRAQEPVCVWGDFDVDGQTSTTILYSTLLSVGAKVRYHIPVRAQESHGVNVPLLEQVIDAGARLVLTCDTGIGAVEAVEYARSRGVDVVVTDHHDLPDSLPRALALADPKFLPADHPLATLSGAGVAYKLAEELLDRLPPAGLLADDLLDLTALGLVADLALLTGEARYLVQRGLQALRTTRRLGLQIMLQLAEVNPAHLTEEHIGFNLGPRLNALGRLGDANPAVELLTTSDPARARLIATQLEGLNAQRQLLTEQVTQAAEAQLRADRSLLDLPVLVLGHPSWPGGVVGIAASRLVERYGRPAILLTTPPGEPARGSARSVDGVNITAAIAAQKDLLLGFGGHPMAAGLSLEADKLPEFRARLAKTVGEMLAATDIEPVLRLDAWLELPKADLELAETLEQLAPFGPGNEKLVLASRGLSVQSETKIGRNKEHRRLNVADGDGQAQTLLWWNGAGEPLPEGRFDLAYTVRASDWRGVRQAQLEWIDFRPLEAQPVEVRRPALEVTDLRGRAEAEARRSLPQGAQVWAEGEQKKAPNDVDRAGLAPAPVLAIWTAPAAPELLRLALQTVRPERVILFAGLPVSDEPRAFLERLTGLVKYAAARREGRATWTGLAAATAQREAAVRLGLEWLQAKGQLVYQVEGDGLRLAAGDALANPLAVPELENGIRTVLAETHAYRQHFARADKDRLIQHPDLE